MGETSRKSKWIGNIDNIQNQMDTGAQSQYSGQKPTKYKKQ